MMRTAMWMLFVVFVSGVAACRRSVPPADSIASEVPFGGADDGEARDVPADPFANGDDEENGAHLEGDPMDLGEGQD